MSPAVDAFSVYANPPWPQPSPPSSGLLERAREADVGRVTGVWG